MWWRHVSPVLLTLILLFVCLLANTSRYCHRNTNDRPKGLVRVRYECLHSQTMNQRVSYWLIPDNTVCRKLLVLTFNQLAFGSLGQQKEISRRGILSLCLKLGCILLLMLHDDISWCGQIEAILTLRKEWTPLCRPSWWYPSFRSK